LLLRDLCQKYLLLGSSAAARVFVSIGQLELALG
jgi:hypothetical protein